jgi:hypothetical protein
MIVLGFDGRQHNWPPPASRCCVATNQSELHLRAKAILKKKYSTMVILEEVPIPGSQLKLDFFVPQLIMAVEVQGQQHTKFNPHFYKDKTAFRRAQLNDQAKKEWCEQHGLNFVELNYDGNDDDWKAVL